MLSALLIFSALLALTAFGTADGLLKAMGLRRWCVAAGLGAVAAAGLCPSLSLGSWVRINLSIFFIFLLGVYILGAQHSWGEVLRVAVGCVLSVTLLAVLDIPQLMMNEVIFTYHFYIKIALAVLPFTFLTARPGSLVAGCLFTPFFYDIVSGVLALDRGEAPLLGGDYSISLAVYTLLAGLAPVGMKILLVRRRRKNTLTFGTGG